MLHIIQTEFQKLRRYPILLVGVTGMVCSPLLQLFSQMVVVEEAREPNFDFAALIELTVWGNATIFLPVLLTLTGGYLINREYTDDTLKNLLTVPLSFRQLLAGKAAVICLLSVLLSGFSLLVTTAVSALAGLPRIGPRPFLHGLAQMTGLAVGVFIAVLPLLALCSRRPGSYMGGSVLAFIAGYCCMFFKSGPLRSLYPFSAVLTLIGFDLDDYAGTTSPASVPLSLVSVGAVLALAALLLATAQAPDGGQKEKASPRRDALARKKPSSTKS